MIRKRIADELKAHAPFTAFGTATGVIILVIVMLTRLPREFSVSLFWVLHPLHVLLSALVTTGIYRRYGNGGIARTLLIGYVGSVGIATLSDSIIPYVGEVLLNLPHRDIHFGPVEKWWLVNPLAFLGIALAFARPATRIPHAGHVLLSTWASLFHITMALGTQFDATTLVLVVGFLFLAVWVPCCTSDIVFPLLFSKQQREWVPEAGCCAPPQNDSRE
jgi:hypothetical protein